MEELGPGGVTREVTGPSYLPPPARISRVGTFVVFFGALLIGISFVIIAIEYYQIVYGPFSATLNFDLYAGSQATLEGVGLILIGFGWVLDQVAVERRVSYPSLPMFGGWGTAAFTMFLAGAVCAAGGEFWYAYLAFAEYAQVTLNLWIGTLPTFEAILATGILLMVLGWFARHLQALRSLEGQPPRRGGPPPGPGGAVTDKIEW